MVAAFTVLDKLHAGQLIVFDASLIGGKLESDDAMVERAEVLVQFSAVKPAEEVWAHLRPCRISRAEQ